MYFFTTKYLQDSLIHRHSICCMFSACIHISLPQLLLFIVSFTSSEINEALTKYNQSSLSFRFQSSFTPSNIRQHNRLDWLSFLRMAERRICCLTFKINRHLTGSFHSIFNTYTPYYIRLSKKFAEHRATVDYSLATRFFQYIAPRGLNKHPTDNSTSNSSEFF